MVRFLLILLFFAISLNALGNSETLKRANHYMKSKSQSDKFRAYNDYKNLYLRAVIEDDSDLKIEALEGIVKSGNELNIDVSKYEKELKKPTLAKEESKKETPIKQTYHKPVSKPMKASEKADEIHVQSAHRVESSKWNNDNLVITFDKELDKEQISYFTIHKPSAKSYKYIIDVKSSILTKFENISKRGISRIKIAQYNPTTVRIVVENSSKIDFVYKLEDKSIVIDLNLGSKYDEAVANSVPVRVDRNKTIVIDPGHGGKDPGAVGYKNYEEKVVVFIVANELEKILKSRGYKVFMTRNSDEFIKLSRRTKYANEKSADIFISIHANAVSNGGADEVHGIECYFLSPSRSNRAKKVAALENSADISEMNIYGKDSYLNLLNHHNILASNKLAIDLQRGMLGSLNNKYNDVKDGGVREGPFWVLVGAQMPSVLVEIGFISHPKEATRLMDSNYRKIMAKGLADGIERYFANN